MNTTTTNTAKLFVTDYASYNEGNQFEHGHWVDLSDFSSADDFNEYLENHFSECGIEDPEPMFTDFEGFPDSLYSESMSSEDLEQIFEYLECEYKMQVCFLLEQGYEISDAISKAKDLLYIEDTTDAIYYNFEEFYPDAVKAESLCDYMRIDYDRYKRENFTEFSFEGEDYLIMDGTY
jgi:hypothetical protein